MCCPRETAQLERAAHHLYTCRPGWERGHGKRGAGAGGECWKRLSVKAGGWGGHAGQRGLVNFEMCSCSNSQTQLLPKLG